MSDDLEDKLFEVQVQVGLLKKGLEAGMKASEELGRQRQALSSGLRQAQENLSNMKSASVVVASEWELTRKLRDTFAMKLQECDKQCAIYFEQVARLRVELSDAESQEKALWAALETIPNNILEFPHRDVRRSEETS